MRRFLIWGAALALVSIVGSVLYLNSRLHGLPMELKNRFAHSGIDLSFDGQSISLWLRTLELRSVSLRSKRTKLRAEANTCSASLVTVLNPKIELKCKPLRIRNSASLDIPGELIAAFNGIRPGPNSTFEVKLLPPKALSESSSRAELLFNGVLSEGNNIEGRGTFGLANIELELGSALDNPFETLRSIPILKDRIGETPRTVKFSSLRGTFDFKSQAATVALRKVRAVSPRFSIESERLLMSQNQLQGRIRLLPELQGIPPAIVDTLRGPDAKFGIPIEVEGTSTEPLLSVEKGWFQEKIKMVARRGFTEESKQFLKSEYETKWKYKVQDFIKNKLRR